LSGRFVIRAQATSRRSAGRRRVLSTLAIS
jgi:hypothetical protein